MYSDSFIILMRANVSGKCSIHRYLPLRRQECGCLHGGVIENGRTHQSLTLCSVPVLVHVGVWMFIPGDPQSVQLRNATTTKTGICSMRMIQMRVNVSGKCPSHWYLLHTYCCALHVQTSAKRHSVDSSSFFSMCAQPSEYQNFGFVVVAFLS